MGSNRINRPVCSIHGQYHGERPNERFAPPSAHYQKQKIAKESGLSPEEEELALDVAQIILDIVGIVEPTPFADGTNALISLGRKDWLGAGLSGLGIIPYIGDLAKAGKLGRYGDTLQKAIEQARKSFVFDSYLQPAIVRLRDVLNSIPDNLSPKLTEILNKIRQPIDRYLGRGTGKAVKIIDLDALTDRLLMVRFGSTKYVAELVHERVRFVAEYLHKHQVSEEFMVEVLSGIDLHKVVKKTPLKTNDVYLQYVDGDVGSWFIKAGSGTGPLNAGIGSIDRTKKYFRVKKSAEAQRIELLESNSAPIVDNFRSDTIAERASKPFRHKPKTKVVLNEKGEIDISSGAAKVRKVEDRGGMTAIGGGTQYYLPPTKGGQFNKGVYKDYFEEVSVEELKTMRLKNKPGINAGKIVQEGAAATNTMISDSNSDQ